MNTLTVKVITKHAALVGATAAAATVALDLWKLSQLVK